VSAAPKGGRQATEAKVSEVRLRYCHGVIVVISLLAHSACSSCNDTSHSLPPSSAGGEYTTAGAKSPTRVTDEDAVRATILHGDPKLLRQLMLSPRFQIGNDLWRNQPSGDDGDILLTPEAQKWQVQAVEAGRHAEDAQVDLLKLVWDELRRGAPLGTQLDETDKLLRSIPIHYASLRGRPAEEVIKSLQEQAVTELRRRGLSPNTVRLRAAKSGPRACEGKLINWTHGEWGAPVPTAESTMSLWKALGNTWRYVDPHTIELFCSGWALAGPVRTTTVVVQQVALRVGVLTWKQRPGRSEQRNGCFDVVFDWPQREPTLDPGATMTVLARAGVAAHATLEELTVWYSRARRAWNYSAKACTGELAARFDYSRALGSQHGNDYEARVQLSDLSAAPSWPGDTTEPSLGLTDAMDLAFGRHRKRAKRRAGSCKLVQLERVAGSNHWIYFVWIDEDRSPDPYSGRPFAVALSGEVYAPRVKGSLIDEE